MQKSKINLGGERKLLFLFNKVIFTKEEPPSVLVDSRPENHCA